MHPSLALSALARKWRAPSHLQAFRTPYWFRRPRSRRFQRPSRGPIQPALQLAQGHEPPASDAGYSEFREDVLIEEVTADAKRRGRLGRRVRDPRNVRRS